MDGDYSGRYSAALVSRNPSDNDQPITIQAALRNLWRNETICKVRRAHFCIAPGFWWRYYFVQLYWAHKPARLVWSILLRDRRVTLFFTALPMAMGTTSPTLRSNPRMEPTIHPATFFPMRLRTKSISG